MLKNDIIVFRAKIRWTQHQLADAVAVSRQSIAALEKEKYNPSLILAFKLANVLETTIEELFSYAEEET